MIGRLVERLPVLAAAVGPGDLNLPGYRLQALKGDLAGWWSIASPATGACCIRLMRGELPVTAAVAVALERLGWSNAEFWLRMQNQFDLARVRKALRAA